MGGSRTSWVWGQKREGPEGKGLSQENRGRVRLGVGLMLGGKMSPGR